MAGLFSDIGDAVIDFMGLAMSMNAVNAVTAGSLSPLAGASMLGNIYKTAKMQGTMGFLTTPGDMEERLQAGAYRVAYNLTPYVANAFTSGYRAVATDFLLNSFLTMPTYLSAFKNSRNPEEFLSMAIPQAVIDLGMAWNTRGSPDTHRRAVINRQVDEFAKAAGISKEDARFFVENDWARADEVMGRNFWEGTSPEMIREGDVKYDRYTGEKYEVTSVRPGSVFARLVGTGREEAVATRVGEIQRIFSDKLSGVLDDDAQIADASKLYAVAAMHAEQVGAVKDALADAKAVTFERSEDGRVVTFSQNAGEGAKTAPLKDLGRAKIMLSRGSRTPEEIFRLTGWEKGFDGEWRFTIDDTKATFQPGLLSRGNVVDGLRDKLSKNVSVRLGDVLNHPALFAAYPHLADMNIYLTEGKYGSKIAGKWSDDLPGIHIGTMASFDEGHNRQKTDFEFMSALIHEIQHSIQNSERGFQHGFGMEGIRARIGIVQDALYKAHEAGDKDAENRYLFELWRLGVPEKEIGLEPSVKVLYDAYRRTAGEAEARAAQLRLTYTEEQLRNESPNETLRKMLVEEGLHKEGDSILDTLLFLPRDPGDPDIAWSIPESAFQRGETIAARDSKYAEAVRNNDMETAQRMVDEAAKEAGYGIGPVYHGGSFNQNVDPVFRVPGGAKRKNKWQLSFGVHFAEDYDEANVYVKKGGGVQRAFLGGNIFDGSSLSVLSATDLAKWPDSVRKRIEDFNRKWNNKDVYAFQIVQVLDGMPPSDASKAIVAAGYSGIKYQARANLDNINYRPFDAYVIVDSPSNIKSADPVVKDDQGNVIPLSERFNSRSPDIRYQGDETAPRGGYTVADDVNRTITLFSKADASTIIHEYLGHHLIERYLEAESRGTLTDEAKADIDLLRKWAGSEDGKLTDEQKETIATAWEKYLMEGKTPHTELTGVFERFKQKLLEVYSVIRGKIDGIELSDDVRGTFDRMLDVKEPGDAPKESRETILEFGKDYLLNEPPKPSAIRALDFPLKHVVDIGGEVRAIGDDFKARKGRLLKTQTKDGKNKTILLQEVLKDSSLTPEDRAEVRQLMRDPVDMPLTIDDVRRLPITDAAVRLGFAGVKVAPIDYEDVPLAKILRSKDQAVKGPALELVKELAKNADMGEDIAWEQRSSNMWILSEYDLKVRSTATQGMRNMMNDAVRENPDLKDALSSADLKSLNLVSLGEMTLGRIRELNAILSENAEKGRAILRERRAAEQERIDSDAMKLRGTLKAELGDGKPVLRKGDLPSAKKNRGALQGAKNLYKMSLTPSRLFDLLDGYKNFKGFWSKLFYGETNKREDEAKYHMQNRRGYVMKVLRDSNLTTKSLADMRTVGTGDDEVTLTRSEAIGVYAHSLVPHQKKGIIDLNGLSERQIDLIVSSLSDGEKAVAHAIIKDFADNFDRIDQAFIRHANVGMDYVPNYTPIYWLFRTGASGSFIDAEKENQLQMVQAANHLKRQYARNGFTKTRVEEYPENMRGAIDLNLFSVWNRALQVHEHFAAYADHIRHLRRVLDWRGADNISNLEHLTNEYGTPMREILESYVNRIADPTFYKADVATNTLNRWIKGLRQNVAVAYLSYNLLTMAKQLPSLAFYAGEAGPHQLLASLGRALIPGEFRKMRKLTETLDPQINERGLDRSIEELRLEWEGKDTIRGRIARFGMKGITAMDRIAVTIGWNAVYESYMAKGASQEEAMQKAQFVTLQTQPASHPKDIPHLYATNNEILNLFLQFTNQVNKVWNITTHDLYTQAKNGDYSTPLVSVVALTLSAAMIHALSGGWNEDETFGDFISQAAGAQFGNSLPVFGRDIVGYFQGYRGGELATSKAARNIFKGFEDALKGEVTEQTAWRLWEAMSVMWLGMPVVGPRRMAQFGETGDPAKLLGLGKTKKKPTFNF
jgi:hypothetical protein